MKKNVGNIDRVIRILIATVAAILYFTGILTGTVGIVLLVVGLVLAITSVISFCPLYWPFGISTGKKK